HHPEPHPPGTAAHPPPADLRHLRHLPRPAFRVTAAHPFPGRLSSGEREVAQAGDAEHGVVDVVAFVLGGGPEIP
ncbi:hypothetical protein ACWDA7_38005, partial [Streptomyces sp. NPDC001156]